MKMKKLLMTGAGLVLVTGMGITAAAVGPNLFSAGTMKQGSAVTQNSAVAQTSAAVYTDGVGSCHISDGYCMNWSDADGDGVCDLCRNPAYCENNAGNGEQGSGNAAPQDSGSAAESQGQNYGGYGSGCYGSGYNGCGNSRQGHHGSGHHGSGHHR